MTIGFTFFTLWAFAPIVAVILVGVGVCWCIGHLLWPSAGEDAP